MRRGLYGIVKSVSKDEDEDEDKNEDNIICMALLMMKYDMESCDLECNYYMYA